MLQSVLPTIKSYTTYDDSKAAAWANSSDEESSDKKDNSEQEQNENENEVFKSNNSDITSAKSLPRFSSDSKVTDKSWIRGTDSNKSANTSRLSAQNSTGKISNILKSFENKEEKAKLDYKKPKDTFNFKVDSRQRDSYHSPSSSFSFSAKEKAEAAISPQSRITEKTVPVPTKASVEKVIKISQKPNNPRGFGFTFAGGPEKKTPCVVKKVNLGKNYVVNVC